MASLENTTKPDIGTAPTMVSLVAWSDQVDAAATELEAAWVGFRLGPVPSMGKDLLGPVHENDRLAATVISLSDSVKRLRTLAEEVRAAS